jgi:hypothetical protein
MCRRTSNGQKKRETNPGPELEIQKGTALAGFDPVTISFRDCFEMPRELWGGRGGVKWKITVLDSDLPLAEARVTQLATAGFRDNF